MDNGQLLNISNIINNNITNFTIDWENVRCIHKIDYQWDMSIIQISIINIILILLMMYCYDHDKHHNTLNRLLNIGFLLNMINFLFNVFISLGINLI